MKTQQKDIFKFYDISVYCPLGFTSRHKVIREKRGFGRYAKSLRKQVVGSTLHNHSDRTCKGMLWAIYHSKNWTQS